MMRQVVIQELDRSTSGRCPCCGCPCLECVHINPGECCSERCNIPGVKE